MSMGLCPTRASRAPEPRAINGQLNNNNNHNHNHNHNNINNDNNRTNGMITQ